MAEGEASAAEGSVAAPALPAADAGLIVGAAVTVVAFVVLAFAAGPWLLNPVGLSAGPWLCLYAASVGAKLALNFAMERMAARWCPRMDAGTDDKVRCREVLDPMDKGFLVLATVAEFVGVCHVAAAGGGAEVSYRILDYTTTSGPIAFVTALFLSDVMQFPFHVLGQTRFFVGLCHKHHLRQTVPFRGYVDASNKHPLEILMGFATLAASFRLVIEHLGLHGSSVVMAIGAAAAMDTLHHLPFDSSAHLPLLFPTCARGHQMHHRLRRCNYGFLTSVCDRLFGTLQLYVTLDAPAPEPPRKKMWYETSTDPAELPQEEPSMFAKAGRPELLPSPWSIAITVVMHLCVCLALEVYLLGDLPRPPAFLPWLGPMICTFNAVLFSAAVESACSTDAVPKRKKTRLYTKPTMKDAHSAGLTEAVGSGHHRRMARTDKAEWKARLSDAVAEEPVIIKRE